MTKTRYTVTTAAFVRSHGRHPKGVGCWAFQQCTDERAFDSHMVGDVYFAQGGTTLTQAKRDAAYFFTGADVEFVAVLP